MNIPNIITLDALRHMAVGEIAALPAEELARLHSEADEALRSAKSLRDWLEGAIALRYGDRAAQARHEAGKDTGTVRFADGAVTVVSDLPKRVEWDQDRLAELVERIRAEGDDPRAYVDVSLKVPERKFTAWPPAIRSAFESARTVRTGKPTFRLVLDGEAPA
ncbi:hypothetical protein [Alterinioella nitratireducens]|uniref:hypothetical protein n=1 Tax=Alterinioella nitratireducens TaxID=2735915 RepID=UPI00155409CF|nr:hypothetical protein [Alterinioella nitratireducens]NPD18850.1 hypothetical protein [Alterinioella nitratireducens]